MTVVTKDGEEITIENAEPSLQSDGALILNRKNDNTVTVVAIFPAGKWIRVYEDADDDR